MSLIVSANAALPTRIRVAVGERFSDTFRVSVLTQMNSRNLEGLGLLDQQLDIIMARQKLDFELVGVLGNDIKDIAANGTGRAEEENSLHFFS